MANFAQFFMHYLEKAPEKMEEFIQVHEHTNINPNSPSMQSCLLQTLIHGQSTAAEFLIRKGVPVNFCTPEGLSPLLIAISQRFELLVKKMLALGADPKQKGPDGESPLLTALKYGYLDIVPLLIEKGADIQEETEDGTTALMRVVRAGKEKMIRYFLDLGADPNIRNAQGHNALFEALQLNNTQQANLISLLVEHGAYAGYPYVIESTSFKLGISNKKQMLKQHLEMNSLILLLAQPNVQEDALKLLIQHGAEIDFNVGSQKNTPLISAILFNHPAVLSILLEEGAQTNFLFKDNYTKNKYTPLGLALHEEIFELPPRSSAEYPYPRQAIVEQLIEHSKPLDALNYGENTAVHIATSLGQSQNLKKLLKKGANPNLQNQNGNTALHIAAKQGNLETLTILIQATAKSHLENFAKQTALQIVIEEKHKACIDFLTANQK